MNYFVSWRENYEDYTGWFDHAGVTALIIRLRAEQEAYYNGECCIYEIIQGRDVKSEFGLLIEKGN